MVVEVAEEGEEEGNFILFHFEGVVIVIVVIVIVISIFIVFPIVRDIDR